MSIFIGSIFLVVGAGLLFAIFESVCMLPFGLIFGGVGYVLLRSALQPMVFDRHLEAHWVGRTPPDAPGAILDLTTVRALQLVPEYIRGDDDSAGYHSYELNLVLHNGERHHVVDHGKREALKADAVRLGVFLCRPVWDNTGVARDEVVVVEPADAGS